MPKHEYIQRDDFERLLYISTLSFKLKYAERSIIIHIAASAHDVKRLRVEVINRRETKDTIISERDQRLWPNRRETLSLPIRGQLP